MAALITTFAIADPADPKKVTLWCEPYGSLPDGTRRFEVINGGWKGHLLNDGTVHVHRTKKIVPGVLVWEGFVPRRFKSHYEEAIAWIEEQIAAGVTFSAQTDPPEPEPEPEPDSPKLDPAYVETRTTVVRICTKCDRNLDAPFFDGCANAECPHGFEPCF